MEKVTYLFVMGTGNVFGFLEAETEEFVEIKWPALGQQFQNERGQRMITLFQFVPEFLTDRRELNMSFNIPKHMILFRGTPNQKLIDAYIDWQEKHLQEVTGIMIAKAQPNLKPIDLKRS